MSQFNLTKEIEKLKKEKPVSKGEPLIYGGKITDNELQDFLRQFNFKKMPYSIIELVNNLSIEKNFDYSKMDFDRVERIRSFGEGGDLDLRRDENQFYWRYIGKTSLPSNIDGEDFWSANQDTSFFVEEKEALLWGKYNKKWGKVHDNRVAKAKLAYPVNGKPWNGVKLVYKSFSDSGVIAFNWFLKIERVDEK
ncbi:MAG: hypothetical protein GF308_07785 [Candidatus Heimdallarchaeota archaeon]|nr:hypothetical protein [Candidatus Heimdallarchaeota archaeon]